MLGTYHLAFYCNLSVATILKYRKLNPKYPIHDNLSSENGVGSINQIQKKFCCIEFQRYSKIYYVLKSLAIHIYYRQEPRKLYRSTLFSFLYNIDKLLLRIAPDCQRSFKRGVNSISLGRHSVA